MEQHQVSRSPQVLRLGRIGPDMRLLLLAIATLDMTRSTDVDDVVVVLDRLVGRDVRRVNAQRTLWRFDLAIARNSRWLGGKENGGPHQHRQPEYNGND